MKLEKRSRKGSMPEVEFVNLTSLTVDVWKHGPRGTEMKMQTLELGQRYRQQIKLTDRWSVRERNTGKVLKEFKRLKPGVVIEITEADLSVSTSADRVRVTFRNTTPRDVVILRIDSRGVERKEARCPAGHYRRVEAVPGDAWRVRTTAGNLELATFLTSGEPEQTCEIVNTLIGFENDSFLIVDVFRFEEGGGETHMATLSPKQFCLLANFAAWRWKVCDHGSGTVLKRVARHFKAYTCRVRHLHLRSEPTDKSVEVTFRNLNHFDVELYWVDGNGQRVPYAAIAGGAELVQVTGQGHVWIVVEKQTRRDVAWYIATREPQQLCSLYLRSVDGVQLTQLEFVNATSLSLDVHWLDFNGSSIGYTTLLPHQTWREQTSVTSPWIVRDRHSKVPVAIFIAEREQPVTRIQSVAIRSLDDDKPVRLLFENATPFRADILAVDGAGRRTKVRTLQPGESAVEATFARRAWQVNRAGTDHELSLFITKFDSEQTCTIALAPRHSDVATTIDFVNRTPLTVEVLRFNEQGAEESHGQLPPGGRLHQSTFASHPWVVRDAYSREVFAAAIGKKTSQRLEITSEHLRSLSGDHRVSVEFSNEAAFEVELRWINFTGGDEPWAKLAPGQKITISTFATHPWCVVSPAFDAEIGLFIPNQTARQRYAIRSNVVGTVERPGGELLEGEVALYEHENYQGRVWILDAGASDFSQVPGLNDIASSVRVGPNTGVTLFQDVGYKGTALDVYMDLPKLSATRLGNDVASSLQLWTIVSPENVGISSRSILVEDYRLGASGKAEAFSNYRTTITLPAAVRALDVWATEEITITVEGQSYVIDPTKPARLAPNRLSRVVIGMEATALGTPGLLIRANTMGTHDRIPIFPDAQLHQKIAELPDGALHRDRDQLGIRNEISEEDCNAVQKAVCNIARTVQYSPQASLYGVHHERQITPATMEHRHWAIDFGGGGATYTPLTKEEVQARTAGARRIERPLTQNFWDDLKGFFTNAASVVVHTVENVAHDIEKAGEKVVGDIVDTAEHLGRDVVNTAEKVGNDLVHGNIGGAFVDLGNGTLSVGTDLASGVEHVGGDLVQGITQVTGDVASGAKQLVVMTIQLAEEAVQFVLDHTGIVGQFLAKVFDKIGAAAGKVIGWLASQVGWDDVLTLHDFLVESANHGLDRLEKWINGERKAADDFFASLEDDFSRRIDDLLKSAGVPPVQPQDALGSHHSDAIDKIEWLLSLWVQHSTGLTSPMAGFGTPLAADAGGVGGNLPTSGPIAEFITKAQAVLGPDNSKVTAALGAAEGYLEDFFRDPKADPQALLGLALEIVKAVGIAVLQLGNALADAVLDAVAALLDAFKQAINAPIQMPFVTSFYQGLTNGRDLTLLSFTCLLVATPATILAKAVEGKPLAHGAAPLAAELPELDPRRRDWGYAYGSLHLILSVVSVAAEAQAATGAGADAPDDSRLQNFSSGIIAADRSARFGSDQVGLTIGGVDIVLGLLTQLCGCPVGYPDVFYADYQAEPFSDKVKDSEKTNDQYWSHVAWYYGWAGWAGYVIGFGVSEGLGLRGSEKDKNAIELVDNPRAMRPPARLADRRRRLVGAEDSARGAKKLSQIVEDVVAGGTTLYGVGTMVLMSCLDASYRRKKIYFENNPTTDEATEYLEWTGQGGIEREGFGNIIGTFPDISALGAAPHLVEATDGISLLVTGVVEFLGHLAEGGTYLDRVRRREI